MNVAFRVDASSHIGTEHFFRCLALADALYTCGWQILFVTRRLPDELKEMLNARGFEFSLIGHPQSTEGDGDPANDRSLGTYQAEDAADTIQALSGRAWEWLVVDHYALDETWETPLRQAARYLAVIDDLADRSHDCDLLLDQNLYADAGERYSGKVPAGSTLLLGPKYSLLREEFRVARRHVTPRDGKVKRVAIFFGGTDVENYTGQAIDGVAGLRIAGLHVDVLVDCGNLRREVIRAQCDHNGFTFHAHTDQMAQLMAAADLAAGAGGTTTWERCCLGLPTLTICAAANQKQQIAAAACDGLLYAPECQQELSPFIQHHLPLLLQNSYLLTSISRACMRAVDGEGVWRVVRNLTRGGVNLRTASAADADNLFNWRNDLAVRAASRIPDMIDRKTHESWVASSVNNANRILLIGDRDGSPVGVVRFDLRGTEAEISIYLVPGPQPPGQGRSLLYCAEQWLSINRPSITRIRARVLAGNERSARLFLGAGYIIEFADYSKRIGLQ